MFKHLTLEIIASPNHVWLGFLGLNVGQAVSTVQAPGTTSPLVKKKNLKDVCDDQGTAWFARKAGLK